MPITVTRRDLLSATAALAGAAGASLAPASAAPKVALPVPVKPIPEPPQAPVTEGLFDVGGARLWYWDTGGDGQTVVLLHPATGSGASWTYQQPVFVKAGYRVIGYSRRGHFRSEISDANAPASDVADLHQLIAHLGPKRLHLVGSAAGTFLAAQYALTYPEQLASVVLGSSLISIQDKEYQELIARVVPASFAMMPPEFRELGPSYRVANPEGTARWIELEESSRIVGVRTAPPATAGTAVTFQSLGALKVPVLLLTGECDLYACPALLTYVAQRLGKHEVVVIDHAGHAAFWEQPEAYNREVLRFLRQHRA
jgi:pimeloyl-ACP methyl ester carboxylesterase